MFDRMLSKLGEARLKSIIIEIERNPSQFNAEVLKRKFELSQNCADTLLDVILADLKSRQNVINFILGEHI